MKKYNRIMILIIAVVVINTARKVNRKLINYMINYL